jgi:acylphosphatase
LHCVVEGDRGALEALLAELRAGPPGARVERVDAEWGRATGSFRDFDVRSGWHPGD